MSNLHDPSVPTRLTSQPSGISAAAADALEADLKRALRGDVRFDSGSRALYSTDASNYRQVPIGVVVPRDREDVLAALEVCRRHGAPVLPRGGGTSLAGQCCNVAVVLDCSRHFARVLEIDPVRRIARVEPGTVLDDLRRSAEAHHLTFGPDPASHRTCTLGGMIGNNSCGVHSVMAGKTDDNVVSLEVVTGDGVRLTAGQTSDADLAGILAAGGRRADVYRRLLALRDRHAPEIRARFPNIPRRVSGYNLPALLPENGFDVGRSLVGSEGTCAFLLEATVRLVWSPPGRCLVVLGFPDVYAAADSVPAILESGPIGLEGLDDGLVSAMRRANLFPKSLDALPPGGGWLLVELGGETAKEAADAARGLAGRFEPARVRVFEEPDAQRRMWKVREAALGATSHAPGQPLTWEGWEDSAVSPERLGPYLRDLRALLTSHGYGGDFYGHFGQGCVHTRTNFDLQSPEGLRRYRAFVLEAADLVISYGGSLSGEHGDGQSRAELLPKMFGETLTNAFREFKAIWDPEGRMNPGKKIDARPLDADLRLAGYPGRRPATHFSYASDGGDFSRAALRCVGVGLCRRTEGGTMCPSWRATREEKHSTRGRARLLFEMLRGGGPEGKALGGDGRGNSWQDESVFEALDLCLSCKGCKGDCPAEVDMATYKAEFLSHYYEGRLRPRSAWAMGLIHRWAPVARLAPRLVNAVMHAPGLSRLAKLAAGISPNRDIPRFARRSFRSLFSESPPGSRLPPAGAPRDVLLWPDTFTDSFHPETGLAAAEVLGAAGFRVRIPDRRVCCGRPLYDHGMLDLARELLEETLELLRADIRAGVPVVVLEPSCASVFQDELPNLFPDDPDARRLGELTTLFAAFLEREAPDWAPSRLSGAAVLQGHCHQAALSSLDPDAALLSRLGLDVRTLDAGCCGMAGAFGFEASHYDVSVAIARDALVPALSGAPDALVVADGFSCREQIRQLAGRRAFHVAEVVHQALRKSAFATARKPLEKAGRPLE